MPYSIHDFARISATAASPGDIIDGFEDANIDEYAGDVGTAYVSTANPYTGTYHLDTVSGGTFIYSPSGGGLPNYPAQDDIFESYVYLTTSSDIGQFAFAVQDLDNYYYVEVDAPNGNLELYKRENAGDTLLDDTTGLTIPTGVWLRASIEWQTDGTITVTVYDTSDGSTVGSVSATDTTFTSGGVGFGE